MSVIDILTRVDAICKKYDRYDVEKPNANISGDDAFARLYAVVEADIGALLEVRVSILSCFWFSIAFSIRSLFGCRENSEKWTTQNGVDFRL